jgi:phosphoribosylglycinamide formyltransferase-1
MNNLVDQKLKIKIAVLGSTRGTDLQAIIDAIELHQLNAKIEIVISNKPDAYILERAKNHNIKAVCIPSKNKTRQEFDNLLLLELSQYDLDLIILIGFMRILTPRFVDSYPNNLINIHPSLLPKFAGGMDTDVHTQVIQAGEIESGCTVHLVSKKVDSGKIILQKTCVLELGETSETLKNKIQKLEGIALVEVIKNWSKNN